MNRTLIVRVLVVVSLGVLAGCGGSNTSPLSTGAGSEPSEAGDAGALVDAGGGGDADRGAPDAVATDAAEGGTSPDDAAGGDAGEDSGNIVAEGGGSDAADGAAAGDSATEDAGDAAADAGGGVNADASATDAGAADVGVVGDAASDTGGGSDAGTGMADGAADTGIGAADGPTDTGPGPDGPSDAGGGQIDGAASVDSSSDGPIADGASGDAAPLAALSISDGLSYSFGTVGLGVTASHVFYVTNTGPAAATSIAAGALASPYSFAGNAYPGLGGTCGTTLAPQATCKVVVDFVPGGSGSASATLSIDYDVGSVPGTATRPMTGIGTTLAFLSIEDYPPQLYTGYGAPPDPATFDYGPYGTGSATDHAFYVTNTGALTATSVGGGVLGAPFYYKGGSFPGEGGSCGASLAPGASCTVVVTFSPSQAQTSTGTLTVDYFDSTSSQAASRPIQGEGTTAAFLTIYDFNTGRQGISLTPTFDYGSIGVGTPAIHSFLVVNSGAVSATLVGAGTMSAPFLYASGYPGAGGSCGATLAPGASCMVAVTFTPGGPGSATGSVAVAYNDGTTGQVATRAVQGTGVTPPVLVISDSSYPALEYSYGVVPVGQPRTATFTVTNQGGAAATSLSAVALTGDFAFAGGFPGTGGSCTAGMSLAVGGSCSVVVTFAPLADGAQTTTLGVGYFDGTQTQQATRSLVGSGTAEALLTISPCSSNCGGGFGSVGYDYGVTGVPADHTFYVTNAGAHAATISGGTGLTAPFAFKGSAFPGGGTCGATLAPGATCTVIVTFTPASAGTTAETFGVNYYDGANSQTATESVSGTATSRALLTISRCQGCGSDPGPFDFGTWGVPTDQTFYLTNTGAQAATYVGSTFTPSSGFAYKNGAYPGTGGACGASIAAGATCSIVLTFTPTGSGPLSSTLAISYHDATPGTLAAQASLTGTATTSAVLTIGDYSGSTSSTDPQPFDFGTWGVPVDHVFYVTNTGGLATTPTGSLPASSGFTFKTSGTFPGASGTCGGSLAPGASCTVVVVFTPSGTSVESTTLTVSYSPDGSSTLSQATRALTGTPTSNAVLTIIDRFGGGGPGGLGAPPFDYGTWGVPVDHTFYVTNTGARATTPTGSLTAASGFTFKTSGSFPGASGTCGGSLAPGSTCTVVVTFTPSGTSVQSGTLTVSYSPDGSSTLSQATRALTGTPTANALLTITDFSGSGGDGVNPSPFDYGTSGVGVDHTFYVTNAGGQATTPTGSLTAASGFTFKTSGTFPGASGTCGGSLAPGSTCTVVVTFTPSGTSVESATLTVRYSPDGSSTLSQATRSITGASTANALLTISDFAGQTMSGTNPPPFDYGTWGVATDHIFYVTNTGARATTPTGSLPALSGFTFKTSGAFPGATGTCTGSLAPGNTCSVVVTFTPSGSGIESTTLTVSYSPDGSSTQAQATRVLTGTPTANALLSITDYGPASAGFGSNPPPFDYGTWGVPADHTFYVTNMGGSATTPAGSLPMSSGFAFQTSGTFPGATGTCTGSLAAGASCTVVVTFTPSGTTVASTTLTVSYSPDGSSTQVQTTRALTGTGTTRALLVISEWGGSPACGDSCGPYSFGGVTPPGTLTHTFTVFNTGSRSATGITDASAFASTPFGYVGSTFPGGGTCSTSTPLAAGASCTIVLVFSPVSTRTFGGEVVLAFGDSLGGGLQADRMLQGFGQ